MALFEWSTPARKREGRILPIIPNEIYFHIFDHIAPPTARLTPEQRRAFTNLSGVCRFFANFCLPRVFRFVELSGSIFSDGAPGSASDDVNHDASLGSLLCTQITAKQPLALALAKVVRVCSLKDWKFKGAGSWAVRLFAAKYTAAISQMENLHRLHFSDSHVDVHHWNAMATLRSLEELTFLRCYFEQNPVGVEPENKVKVSRFQLCYPDGPGIIQAFTSIDALHLRDLTMDILFFDRIEWHSLSALTSLCLQCLQRLPTQAVFVNQLHTVLMQVPRTLEVLRLAVHVKCDLTHDFIWNLLNNPAWQNLVLLSSLTLDIQTEGWDALPDLPSILEGADLLRLESFTLNDFTLPPPPLTEMRCLLDKLESSSRLKYIKIRSTALHLVDGEWLEVK